MRRGLVGAPPMQHACTSEVVALPALLVGCQCSGHGTHIACSTKTQDVCGWLEFKCKDSTQNRSDQGEDAEFVTFP